MSCRAGTSGPDLGGGFNLLSDAEGFGEDDLADPPSAGACGCLSG